MKSLALSVQLAQAEAAFRVQKSELSIRPIWHLMTSSHTSWCASSPSCCGTLSLCSDVLFLGAPRAQCSEESSASSADDVRVQRDLSHGEIRLRCVTQPDELQSLLFERLGITLLKRLRIDDNLPDALSA
ncbi:MAG: hypothetical protein U1F35_09015 [Steroidobacteraceae bacterium]